MQEWTNQHDVARVEIARVDNVAPLWQGWTMQEWSAVTNYKGSLDCCSSFQIFSQSASVYSVTVLATVLIQTMDHSKSALQSGHLSPR